MQHISDFTAEGQHLAMKGFIILWTSALRNYMDFISLGSQFDLSIIDYLSSLYIIQNGVLTAYLHKQTSDQYHYGLVRRCI